ncbi:MAG: DUF975 family protein [Sarcina sp.]
MISRTEIKSKAKEQLKANLGLCILAIIFCTIMINFDANIKSLQDVKVFGESDGFHVSIDIIGCILGAVFTVGLSKFILNIVNYKKSKFTDVFFGFKIFFKSIGMYLIMLAIIIIGLICLVVPGFIAAIGLSMAPYILAEDKEKGIIQCLKESWELISGYKFDYFILQLSFIPWFILGVVTFGIGFLWIVPYMSLTDGNFYLKLKQCRV